MISFLSGLLFVIDIVCALLLIGIILIQPSKSGGGLGAISGGMTESVFGAAAGNVITKATVVLASVFLVSTLLLVFLSKYEPETESMTERLKQKEQSTAVPFDDRDAAETGREEESAYSAEEEQENQNGDMPSDADAEEGAHEKTADE